MANYIKSDVVCMFRFQHLSCLHFHQVNMSLIVHDSEAKQCIEALHQAFFEDDVLTEIGVDGLHMS